MKKILISAAAAAAGLAVAVAAVVHKKTRMIMGGEQDT